MNLSVYKNTVARTSFLPISIFAPNFFYLYTIFYALRRYTVTDYFSVSVLQNATLVAIND